MKLKSFYRKLKSFYGRLATNPCAGKRLRLQGYYLLANARSVWRSRGTRRSFSVELNLDLPRCFCDSLGALHLGQRSRLSLDAYGALVGMG